MGELYQVEIAGEQALYGGKSGQARHISRGHVEEHPHNAELNSVLGDLEAEIVQTLSGPPLEAETVLNALDGRPSTAVKAGRPAIFPGATWRSTPRGRTSARPKGRSPLRPPSSSASRASRDARLI